MWLAKGLLSLLGRVLFCSIFLVSAVMNKIPNFNHVAANMQERGIPEPRLLLVGAILFLLVGGVLVLTGYRARLGAGLLLVFLGLATYYYHGFWRFPAESSEYRLEQIQFLKNLALAGTLIFILANGPGAWSLSREREIDDREFV